MKTEPTLGNLFGLFKSAEQKVVEVLDHSKLVEEALDAFTKAETKMTSAIAKIDEEVQREADTINEAQAKLDAEKAEASIRIQQASESRGKLQRVLERVKALTA